MLMFNRSSDKFDKYRKLYRECRFFRRKANMVYCDTPERNRNKSKCFNCKLQR